MPSWKHKYTGEIIYSERKPNSYFYRWDMDILYHETDKNHTSLKENY